MSTAVRLTLFFLFGALFFSLFLFLPQNDISVQENRALAKVPKLAQNGSFNLKIGKDIENYLQDHIWLRNQMIDAHFKATFKINGRIENDKAFIGDDGWMFAKRYSPFQPIPKETEQKQMEQVLDLMMKIQKILDKKGARLYVVATPHKNRIYARHYSNYIKTRDARLPVRELQAHLAQHTHIKLIYPFDEMMRESEGNYQLFRKDDSHLTNFGFDIVIRSVHQELQDVFPKLKNHALKRKAITMRKEPGYTAARLNIKERTQYADIESVSESKGYRKIKKEFKVYPDEKQRVIEIGETPDFLADKKIYVAGPCYGWQLFDYFKRVFKKSIYVRIETSTPSWPEYLFDGIEAGDIFVVVLIDELDVAINWLKIILSGAKN